MNASKLSRALIAMSAARTLLWEHVPPGTEGKVTCDLDLFKAMMEFSAELSLVDVPVEKQGDHHE